MIQFFYDLFTIEELIIKMSISEKINATNNKIKQINVRYNLNRQTAKISALSSGMLVNVNF